MSESPESRLAALGLELPPAPRPAANYVTFVRTGNLVYTSGSCSAQKGKLGTQVTVEQGYAAAKDAILQCLGSVKWAVGDLDKVTRCVRLGGFINAVPTFAALAPVMNGASDLMVEALGDAGRHARSTVGVAELPLDACVEVEGMFEVQ